MKAALCKRYGPPEVIQIVDRPKPEPKDDEVLIRMRASAVNSGDARMRAARVPRGMGLMLRLAMGLFGPRQGVLGFEVAGDVEAVGKDVTAFKLGDRVVASNGFKLGAHAEYLCVATDKAIALIPEGISYADAVSVLFGGFTSKLFLELGALKKDEKLLINGASGAVGVMAIQLAKHAGAEVTAVCGGGNAELVRSLGADHVIDYTKEDFTKASETYDVIMDTHGNTPYVRVKHLLKPGGRFLMVIGDLWQMISGRSNKAIIDSDQGDGEIDAKSYRYLMELLEQGVLKPVIEKIYAFEDIVAAHRHVDSGHKKGSVVLTID